MIEIKLPNLVGLVGRNDSSLIINWIYVNKCTTCFVRFSRFSQSDPRYYNYHYTGKSQCSESDQFVKDIGRQLSLARALNLLSEDFSEFKDKELRQYIWSCYLCKTRRPKTPKKRKG